jgi:hypothetical protein
MEYTYLMKFIDLFTFAYMTAKAFKMLRIFIKTSSSIPIVYFVIYALYGYPILYNICVDGYVYPDYFNAFNLVSYDLTTQILANSFIILLTFFLTRTKYFKNHTIRIHDTVFYRSRAFFLALWIVISFPIIYVIMTGNLLSFLSYASVAQSLRSGEISVVYTNVFNLSLISVICMGTYIICKKKLNPLEKMYLFILIALVNYFVGKRYILYFTAIVLIFALYISNKTSSKRIVKLAIGVFGLLIVYNIVYLMFFKNGEYTGGVNFFESMYIDLGRMDRLKMATYSILYPNKLKILEYPMETIIYNVLFFVPRGIWESKPFPYSYYFSYKVMFPSEVVLSYEFIKENWSRYGINGMTTSIVDEIITNLSWFGYILMPFLFVKVSKFIDNQKKGVSKFIFLFLVVYATVFCIDPVIFTGLIIIALLFKYKIRFS